MAKPSINPNRDQGEAAMMGRIQREELRSWIYRRATDQEDSLDFMTEVCQVLTGMQGKGLIEGFVASHVGGRLIPIVNAVSLIRRPAG